MTTMSAQNNSFNNDINEIRSSLHNTVPHNLHGDSGLPAIVVLEPGFTDQQISEEDKKSKQSS